MILILGPSDIHTERVAACIRERGEAVAIVNAADFPQRLAVSWGTDASDTGYLDTPAGNIPLSAIRSVYWYSYHPVTPVDPDSAVEAESGFGSVLRNLDCLWVNPPQAVAMHRYKAHQLKLLHAAGIRVPDSLVTNDGEALRAFYEKHRGNVICKPLYHGLLLHRLTPEDLAPEKLARLRHCPLLFQEYVAGEDIRLHLVGDRPFASRIISPQFNYKTDFHTEPITLPDDVVATGQKAARLLDLVLTGLDFRRTPQGDMVLLEANPSPQYLVFEDQCGYPISPTLAEILCGKA